MTKSNANVVVSVGGWSSKGLSALACNESKSKRGNHYMVEIAIKRGNGEKLITSECKWCGCRIVDCPTI